MRKIRYRKMMENIFLGKRRYRKMKENIFGEKGGINTARHIVVQ